MFKKLGQLILVSHSIRQMLIEKTKTFLLIHILTVPSAGWTGLSSKKEITLDAILLLNTKPLYHQTKDTVMISGWAEYHYEFLVCSTTYKEDYITFQGSEENVYLTGIPQSRFLLNCWFQIGIVSFNDGVSTPGEPGIRSPCYSERLAQAIPTNIGEMKDYVRNLIPHGRYLDTSLKIYDIGPYVSIILGNILAYDICSW